MFAMAWQVSSVTAVGPTVNGLVCPLTGAGSLCTTMLAVAPLLSTIEIVCPASGIGVPPVLVPVRAHWPVEVTVARLPLVVTIAGETLNPGGCVTWYGGRPPMITMSALTP